MDISYQEVPMGRTMNFDFGLEKDDLCVKKKNRWLFKIQDVSADGVECLPPSKGARPNISFKTMEILHINETITRPIRPEWKPINLVLFDIKKKKHPVFEWLKKIYVPKDGTWKRPGGSDPFIKDTATLEVYDGCGEILESWTFENVWFESADFTDLDMGSSELLYCNLSIRYDRAYIDD